MYSPQVLDHFEHPRNVGELPAADAVVKVGNPACGDLMQLALKLDGQRISAVRYRTKGCVTSIACGSALTEMLAGKTLDQARALRRQALVEHMGGLTPETMHASHLVFDALSAALQQLSAR